MPTTVVNSPDGRLIDVNHPDGATDEQILSYAAQQYALDPSIAYDPSDVDDDTTTLGALGEFGKRALGGVGTGAARVVSGLGQLLPGVDDKSLIEKEMAVRQSVSEALDYDPAYDENYIAQLGQVAGEMVPQVASFFLPGGIPARAAQLATMIGPAVSEGGMDRAAEEQERGEALTDYERLASKGADIVLGRLEQFGLPSRILKGLPKGFFQTAEGNPILRRIESMVISGLSEGTQEAAQGILRDITTKAIYDPDRAIADSVVEDFQLGGGAGALFDFVISSVTGGNRRTPKVDAPEEIRPPTDEEIEAEQQARAKESNKEDRRRRAMDRALSAQAPTPPPDPRDTTGIDPELTADEITQQVVDIAGAYRGRTTIPAGSLFEVQEQEGKFYVTHEGEQFGPAMRDPIKAQEVKAALSERSDNLNVERIIRDSGIEYTPQESAKVMRFYQQIRNAGRRYTPEDPAEPTILRQPEPPARVNLLENRINTALNRKGVDADINSAEGAGIVQTIIGRPVSESKPLADLSAVEQDYVFQAIQQADPLTPQARATAETREQVDPVTGVTTPGQPRRTGVKATLAIPNFAAVAKPVEPTVPSEPVEAGKEIVPFDPDQETLQDTAIESEIGRQLQGILKSVGLADDFVVKTVDQVGRARRDTAGNVYISPTKKKSGDEESFVTFGGVQLGAKVIQISVDGVKYRVDQGMSFEEATAAVMNHEILHALRGMDLFTAQEYSLLERLTRQYSKPGTDMTYGQWAVSTYPELSAVAQQEEAIAEMISDSLTNNVLIDGKAQALSGKPAGIIQRIVDLFKRLVGFARDNDINSYQELVNAIQTGQVGGRERGQVRTLVRTEQDRGEIEERSITTEELQLRTGTRPTREQLDQVYNNLVQQVKQQVGDAPEVVADSELEEVLESRGLRFPKKAQTIPRLVRAIEEGFDVNTVYYHGTDVSDIKKFNSNLGMGVISGFFTRKPKRLDAFTPTVAIPPNPLQGFRGRSPVVYPVFIRQKGDNQQGGLADIRELIKDENNPVRQALSTPLSRQPDLKADLEAYFAKQLEAGKEGVEFTTFKTPEQIDEANFYYQGYRTLEEVAATLAEQFHLKGAQGAYAEIAEGPYDIDFQQLEVIAPYIKEAGFNGYYDIENAGEEYVSVAMFNPGDVKGVFAEFDPDSVPEGMMYEDDIMFSRKRVGTTGQYIGAPKGVDTPSKLRSLLNTVKGLAEEGEYGRFWYERSGRQILELVGGDKKEAEKIVQAIAITSPMTPVPTNFQYALQAYYQNKAGEPIKTGMFSTSVSRDLQNMFRGIPWEGRKTNNFYINLMREIDPTLVQGVTNDMWMMRAFQQFTDSPTPAQYDFVESETKKLADQLGWEPQQVQAAVWVALKSRMQSKTVKRKVDDTSEQAGFIRFDVDEKTGKKTRIILDEENHRKNWFRTAMKHTPTLKEREDAKFDYADASESSTAQSSWESAPSKPSGHMSQLFQSPMNQRLDYHKQISTAMLDNDGNDIIAKEFEVLSPGAFEAPGFFEEETSPGSQTQVVLPKKYKAKEATEVEPAALDMMEAYSAAVGILLKQDGVGYHRPFFIKNLSRPKANGLDVDIGRPLTTEEMMEVGRIYIEESGDTYASPVSTSQGFRLINFDESVDNKTFQSVAERVLERVDLPDFVAKRFASQNGYLGNNWTENLNGEGYLQDSRLARRPDLQKRVRDIVTQLTPRIEAVEAEFTQKYGWEPNTALNQEYRDGPEPEQLLESRRRAPPRQTDPAKIEKAVQQNQQEARNAGFSVPLYSVKASPEAQYIARNPEAAVEPEEVLESRAPEYNTKTKSFINRLIEGTPERVDPMKQYMDVTGDNSTLDYKLTQAKQALVNRYARLEKLNQRYFKDYLADSSSIAAVLFADRSAGVMAEAIKSGVPQYKDGLTKVVDFTHNGKQYRGLIDIINLLRTKKYGDITEFAQAYAIAMRGERLNKEGKPTPVSQQDIDEARENIKQFTDINGYNPVVEWYGAWQAYNNQVITFLEDTGVIDEKGATSWRLASDYIPFYRALEPNYETGKVTDHPFGDLKQVGAFKPYKGKTDKINVPLVESILKNTAAAIDLGMRNVAQQRIARDMQKLQLAKQVKYGTKGNDIITLKVQGKPVSFRIYDPLILESMSAIDGSGIEEISRIAFGPFSTLLRETVTRTPGFMLANMLRDSLSAFVTSGSSFVPLLGTTKGFFSNINNLERTGVVGGYDFKIDQQDIGKVFAQEADRRQRNGLPLNMFKTIWDASGRLTTRSDAATRQAVYDEVYARTGNEAEAHFQAMEVLNFSRRGSNGIARAITAAIPFLNARIQGLDVLWRSSIGVNTAKRGVPRGTAALSFAMRGAILSFATALYWMMVSDDEEYKEASREEKDNNWLFPLKGVEGVGAVKIPIPFEVGLIFKTIPEVVLDTTYGDRTSRQAFQSFKQGVGSTLELNLLYGIQAYAPLLEAHSNYSSYTGRPIVPIWLTGQRPEYQRTDSTSETAIFLQKATPYLASIPLLAMDEGGTSPMKIEHVIKGYTGSMGGFILSWTDRVLRSDSGREAMANAGYDVSQPEMPSLALYDYPVVKRFLTRPEGSGLKEQFYELYNEVRQDYNTINTILERGDQDEFNSLYPKIENLLAVKNDVYFIRKQLSQIRQDKKAIMRSDMDSDQKKYMLDQLAAEENEILKVVPILEQAAQRSTIRGI